jgi:WD40 repeat protein/serine/threonine protein kinase
MNEESIFIEALGMQDPERAAFLDERCKDNAELRRQVEALLQAHDHPDPFLEGPAQALAAKAGDPSGNERPGTAIGPYKLLEQIGEGGMGLVFVAEQQQPVRRKVALKVIKPGMDTRQVIARFEAERQALAVMDHPNIAKVYDGGETGSGRPYFVMELVKGVPITEYCDQNQVPVRERLELFLNVCQAVQHAHQKGIIHRDIKPSNVLVMSDDGTPLVKVIDFGVAKAIGQQQLTDKTLYTQSTQLVGTPLYMSPEQAGQSGRDVDTRTDIYALGVLLYELLTGTTPFDKERLREADFDEIRRIIREEEPAKPSTRISTLGQAATTITTRRRSDPRKLSQLFRGELDWIVMKCLEKERNRRYETANSLAADVQHYLRDEPVQACPPSTGYRFRKFARRNKGTLVTAALVSLALVLTLTVLVISNIRIAGKQDELDRANRDLVDSNESLKANLYIQRIALAERELAVNHGARAEQLLDLCPAEQRGWEWHLLKRRIHEEPLVLTGHTRGVTGVAFSPDQQVLASTSFDGTVRLWDPATGQLLRTLTEGATGFLTVAFSPNGQLLAAANSNGTVVWELAPAPSGVFGTRATLTIGRQRLFKGRSGRNTAFSPDNRHLALTSVNHTVTVWDLATDAKKVLSGHADAINGAAYHPDGTRLATAGADQTVRIWDVRTGETSLILAGHQDVVTDVAFSADGQYVAGAGRDRTVRVWNATAGTEVWVLSGHTSAVDAIAFSPDSRRLVSAADDGTVKVWDVASGQEAVTLRGHTGPVAGVAFSPDGRRLASAGGGNLDRTVRIWNATPVEDSYLDARSTFTEHTQDVTCLAFSRDGNLLASGSLDRSVRVRNLRTGELTQVFRPRKDIRGVVFSPDGTHVAACGGEGTVVVWHAGTGQELWGHAGKISTYTLLGITSAPDGRHLALADPDRTVHILDAATGEDLHCLNGDIGGVRAVAYRPDGRRLAACGGQKVLIWDLMSSAPETLRAHEAPVTSIAYRFDGQWLASGDSNGWAILWDAADAQGTKLIRRIRAHRDAITSVAFSADSRLVATASLDGTVKLWDPATGKLVCMFRAGQRMIFAVAFHPDGQTLASAGADGTVKLWKCP